MKKSLFLFSILILFILTLSNCNKNDNDDPVPTEKKKYAWATGLSDGDGNGIILFSPDAGEIWTRQGENSDVMKGIQVIDIWAVDENNVWAGCNESTLLKTANGGDDWNIVQLPGGIDDAELSSISIVDKSNIWIGGDTKTTGVIYNSTDMGNSWVLFDTTFFYGYKVQGIWAVNDKVVYATGSTLKPPDRGFIAYTLDGGVTWDSLVPANNYNENFWIGAVSYGNTIVIYGGTAHYIVSTDGGNTWKNDSIPDTGGGGTGGADINDLIMLDSQTWWGALDLGNIFITTDGGENWVKQPSTDAAGGSFLVGIDNWDNQLALVVSYAFYYPPISPILKTNNGGASWESMFTLDTQMWKVSFIKD